MAHQVCGIASTINSANYVYVLCLEKIIKQMPTELVSMTVDIFADYSLKLHKAKGIYN